MDLEVTRWQLAATLPSQYSSSEKNTNVRRPHQDMREAWSWHYLSSWIKQCLAPDLSPDFPVTWANKFLLRQMELGLSIIWSKHNWSGVMMITSEKPQGSSGQITTDDIFPTRDPPQNHLGAFYKIQANRSGPRPSRSREGHMRAIGKFCQVRWFSHAEYGCYGSTHREGEAKRRIFLENTRMCESQFQSLTWFFTLFWFSSFRVKKKTFALNHSVF